MHPDTKAARQISVLVLVRFVEELLFTCCFPDRHASTVWSIEARMNQKLLRESSRSVILQVGLQTISGMVSGTIVP